MVDGDGSKIELKDVQPKFTFDTCYVRHFYTRTIEEYIATKIKRGVGVVNKELTYDLSAFFLYNKHQQKIITAGDRLSAFVASPGVFGHLKLFGHFGLT